MNILTILFFGIVLSISVSVVNITCNVFCYLMHLFACDSITPDHNIQRMIIITKNLRIHTLKNIFYRLVWESGCIQWSVYVYISGRIWRHICHLYEDLDLIRLFKNITQVLKSMFSFCSSCQGWTNLPLVQTILYSLSFSRTNLL